MKIVILGKGTVSYLQQNIAYLEQMDRKFKEVWKKDDKQNEICNLTFCTFDEKSDRTEFVCIEVDFFDVTASLQKNKEQIYNADEIINLIPIKWFPMLRYNVDEEFDNISSWNSIRMFFRSLTTIAKDSCLIRWIWQGIEKLECVSDFFYCNHNRGVLEVQDYSNYMHYREEIYDVMSRFFHVIDEDKFYEELCNKNMEMYFGFDLENMKDCNIGKKTVEFWLKVSMKKLFPRDIFTEDDVGDEKKG